MAPAGSLTLRRVVRQTVGNGRRLPPRDTTEYIQADRKRTEHGGVFGYRFLLNGPTLYRSMPRTALITRCDRQKVFLINVDDREFTEWPVPVFPTRQEVNARIKAVAQAGRPDPTVRVEIETIDTGERKDFFGHQARHVITTRRVVPLTSVTRDARSTVIDGWYIDLDTGISCDRWWRSESQGLLTVHKQGEQPPRPIFTNIGEPERGYAVRSRTTDEESTLDVEVTDLSTAALDPALFEVPAGFSRVEQIRQEPIPPFVIRLKHTYERLKRRARIGVRAGRS